MSNRIFFTSDTHFNHKSILTFCPTTRHGSSVEEMNELLIERWNEDVALGDRVYILGDFAFGNKTSTEEILKRLKGRLFLIKGNHDYWVNEATSKYFEAIYDYKTINVEGQKVVMFHYPIFEWDAMHYGAYHLYGHVHGSTTIPGRALDVGIDARPQRDMRLWSWEEVDATLKTREIRTHHGKAD